MAGNTAQCGEVTGAPDALGGKDNRCAIRIGLRAADLYGCGSSNKGNENVSKRLKGF